MLKGGSAGALLWNPLANGEIAYGLITDVRQADGGQPTAYYEIFHAFHTYFSAGTPVYSTTTSTPDLEALASAEKTLLINKSAAPLTARLGSRLVEVPAYGLALVDTPGQVYLPLIMSSPAASLPST